MMISMKSTIVLLAAVVCMPFSAVCQGAGYWHTNGNQILDARGQTVRIAGINWYGFETTDEVVHGLYDQDYHTILSTIKALGYNTIRLPFSNQMVENPIIPSAIGFYNGAGEINADLTGLNTIEIMDKIVDAAGAAGLKIILDNHRSEAGDSNEANGLWYTDTYSESDWIGDWQMLASRYKSFTDAAGNPTLIGLDLRNEPHLLVGTAKSGACWTGDTMSGGCPLTNRKQNWPAAAARAAAAIAKINPNLLIFVEGIDCYDNNCGWQGGNLEGAAKYPVTLPVAGRLVYSAHDYGPDLYPQPWFNKETTDVSLETIWMRQWAYLSIDNIAPVWMGEFGTSNDSEEIESNVAGSQGQWFSALTGFLANHPRLSWTYWAVNGEDNYGLLDNEYDETPLNSLKQQALEAVQFPLNLDSGGPCAVVTQAPAALKATALSSSEIQLSWQAVAPPAHCAVTYRVFRGTARGFTPSIANQVGTGLTYPDFTDSELTSSTTYYYAIEAVDGHGDSRASVQAEAETAGKQSGLACHVNYSLVKSWDGGFQAALEIDNLGSTNLTAWTLQWTFAGSQQVTSSWSGVESQSGDKVTVTNASYNGLLPAGGILQGIGFTANYTGANLAPAAFRLNGVLCK